MGSTKLVKISKSHIRSSFNLISYNRSSWIIPNVRESWEVVHWKCEHYIDVIMTTMASQITSLTIVYSIAYSDADQRKHQSSNNSPGYLLIYPPQIATIMKPISFSSKYSYVSHTKSLGESREWNMVFRGNIWYRLKAFKKNERISSFLVRQSLFYSFILNKSI